MAALAISREKPFMRGVRTTRVWAELPDYPKFLDFPESEYKRRHEAAKTLMSERRIDALLITTKENLIYFTGYRTDLYDSKFRPFICILPCSGEPVMLVPDLERWGCVQSTWIKDVRHYGLFLDASYKDAISATVDILKNIGLGKGTIGTEIGPATRIGMSLSEFEKLKVSVPDIKFVDPADLVWRIRSIKTEEEIGRVKKACQITEKAIAAAWGMLKEAVSERELASVIYQTMIAEGADELGALVTRSGFARLNMLNPPPSDYRIKHGDLVLLDLGAVYRDYWSDMTRMAILGQPSQSVKDTYKIVTRAQEEAMKTIREGVKAKDVDAAATRVFKDTNTTQWMLHRTGHSVGLDVHELPSLGPFDETTLQEGMILTVEPGLYPLMYTGGIGNFLVEDMVVVRKNGYDLLTVSSRDLYTKS
jgi:Xaa-Pro dipeptidase